MAKRHVVQAGECIDSIGELYGFFPDTLWDHPDNAELRKLRVNRNVLLEGDVVAIPDKRQREEKAPVGRSTTFKRKGVPSVLSLRLLDGDKPRAGLEYEMVIDGKAHPGKTDANGWLEEWVPPNAKRAKLVISDRESYDIQIGRMDPVDTESGLRGRLENLGYLDPANKDEASVAAAISRFQRARGLKETGEVSDELRHHLVDANGS
jgi:putative peptidoglycan binding protein